MHQIRKGRDGAAEDEAVGGQQTLHVLEGSRRLALCREDVGQTEAKPRRLAQIRTLVQISEARFSRALARGAAACRERLLSRGLALIAAEQACVPASVRTSVRRSVVCVTHQRHR